MTEKTEDNLVKIQVDLPYLISRALEIHLVKYELQDKKEALVNALQMFFSIPAHNYFELIKSKEGVANV